MSTSLGKEVEQTAQKYGDMYNKSSAEDRKANYTTLVNQYYDLATDFYEYGWGTSFHFAPRGKSEELQASIARHEHYLALKLNLKPGDKVLDVGCGVGGPLMEIARFSGAHITGVNNNAYQIARGTRNIAHAGLSDTCGFLKADFMKVPKEDNTYDAIYAIEATCHAPTKVGIYSEIYRMLKPGGYFAAYEWLMTDLYDSENAEHNKIKKDIEIGDGLPNLDTIEVTLQALREAGYEVIEHKDLAVVNSVNCIPWWQPLAPGFSLQGFRLSTIGKLSTHYFVSALERFGFAPKGTTQTHGYLLAAADGLLKGGRSGIFTPMYYFLVRKPLDAKN